ncbi:hypothetical protein KKE75_04440 [Patescibacteria group bacterium]|nr:hypothetical protein [Patescibacteria group bacterium]
MNKYYNRKNHIKNLLENVYYTNLILLRNCVEMACDEYFQKQKAPKIDLYLIAREVSSPIARGSDSLPLSIHFGKKDTYLMDSAQFGMEPLVQKEFSLVYCYLPSFRAETPDDRHLNQFYHCEAELRGNYIDAINVAEKLVQYIFKRVLILHQKKVFKFSQHNFPLLPIIAKTKFPQITFDEAHKILTQNKLGHLIKNQSYGRSITNQGEKKIVEIVTGNKLPLWITKYDRDTVPFYQLPDPKNKNRTLNADLLFPSLNGGFGGEIVGSGQRQKNVKEIFISMKRQDLKGANNYKWYIDLRRRRDYKATAGFGLGIERLITWMLQLSSIHDACVYPVIKADFE